MAIRAGELDTRIAIQQRVATQDAAGEEALHWEPFAERWASIARTPGTEIWASASQHGRVPTVFRLRYLAGVMPAMRVVAQGHVYNIRSVVRPGGRSDELLLVSEEIVEETP